MNKLFAIIFSLQLIIAPVTAKADAGAGAYVKALSSLALGATGTVAITGCNFAWSTTVFSIASIAMVAGDILLAKSYTEYQKKKKSEIKFKLDEFKTANGDIQKEVIDQRLDMENEELKHMKKRELLHYAIGTALLAAAVLAYFEIVPTYAFVPNPLYIPDGSCRLAQLKFLGIGVSTLIKIAWGAASSAGGGTSGAGQLFTYLQMGLSLATEAISTAMSSVFSSAGGRAVFFGANSVLVYWVAADISSRKSIVKDNIAQLKKVVADVKKTETTEGVTTDLPGAEEAPENPDVLGGVKALAQAVVPKSCLSVTSTGSSYGESSCASAVKLNVPKFPAGVNPLIASLTGNMVSATNDLASGDWDSAEIKLAGVAAQASRVKELLATVQKEHNERLKAEKKPTIDFDAAVNKQIASIQNEVGAGIGAGPDSASISNVANTSSSDSSTKETIASPKVEEPATISMPETVLSDSLGSEDVSSTSAATASLDDSLGQYESTVEDISKKSEVSIFKQVSNRYLLNYTKIFKEKKRIQEASP